MRSDLSPTLIVAILLAGGLAGSCAKADDNFYSASSSDGGVEFVLMEDTARSAFASFCERQTEERCDAFENYKMTAVFDENLFRLLFQHRSPTSAASDVVVYITCAYPPRGRECGSEREVLEE